MSENYEHIEDSGKVIWAGGNKVKVELERGGGCKSCQLRGMCFAKNTPAIFELSTDLKLQEGDRVLLEISPATRIVSSLLIFIMPVIFLFAGFIIASQWLAELPSIAIGFAALASSFLIVRLVDRRFERKLNIRIGDKL